MRRRILDGLESQVGVRSDVPVVRNRDRSAAAGVVTDRGVQEAALAFVAQRKRQPRQIEDWHSLEFNRCGARFSDSCTRVEGDALRFDLPRLFCLGASRETHAFQIEYALRTQLHGVRCATRGSLLKLKGGRAEVGAESRRVVAAVAGELYEGVLVFERAVGLDRVVFGVVSNLVAVDLPIALLHGDVPLQGQVARNGALEAVGVHVDLPVVHAGLLFLYSLTGRWRIARLGQRAAASGTGTAKVRLPRKRPE